jgi:proton glutamate symport protein
MSQPVRILLGLVLGLVTGVTLAATSPAATAYAITGFQPLGTAWLNALQMTVVPLIVSLVVTGVAATAAAANAGRVTLRAVASFVVMATVTASVAALVTPLLLAAVPMPAAAAASLKGALAGADPVTAPPGLAELLAQIVPTNVVAAAANGAFLSLIVFTLAFAFAITRLNPELQGRLVGFFEATREAMLVLIGWVLWLAPAGVFALALVVGGKTGTAAVGALLHYIGIVCSVGVVVILLGFVVAAVAGGVSPARFERAALPAHAVAISTQSSLASLPAMLKGAQALGVPVATAGVVLPLAVTMFRATQPAMNMAVSIYLANWFGVPLTAGGLVAAVVVGVITSLGSVSLPAQITFYASIAPVAIALGAPIEALGLLIAVETIPDIFRTLGNVTMDMAVTVAVSARGRRAAGMGAGEGQPLG